MSLSRDQIVDAAYDTLRADGLPGVSMRRLAQTLGVRPGALYYHVASKQDLLALLAERILEGLTLAGAGPERAAHDLRDVLLPVRDSADVISFVQAFRPEALGPFQRLHEVFAPALPERQARWAARTLIHYVLGFVAEEHNRADLIRAGIISGDAGEGLDESRDAFAFGVRAFMEGLRGAGERHPAS